MWIIYLIILAALGVLFLISIREQVEEDWHCDTMYRIFLKPALWLEKKRQSHSRNGPHSEHQEVKARGSAFRAGVREDMAVLYPSDAGQRIFRYSVEKLSALLLLAGVGALLALLLTVAGRMNARLSEDGWLARNSYGGGAAFVELEARMEKGSRELQIEVEEREYTREELEAMLPRLRDALAAELKAENSSLNEIVTDLSFPGSVNGFPFQIQWESGNYERIQSDGKVKNEDVEEKGELVELAATLSYREQEWQERFTVRVCPPQLTEEEALQKLLKEEIGRQDEAARYAPKFQLPETVGGEAVSWKEKLGDNSLLLFGLFALAAVVQFCAPDRELKKKLAKREEQLLLSYPEFISKLVLLMGAGLPVRAAFMRMASDYRKKKKRTGVANYVYEEMILTCREMESGITEVQAYEHFGQRCRLTQYRKCTALLVQNLKKGSAGLLRALQEESENSFEERKRNAREAGEKAGTRLLLPMMMMLAVVMVLIMVPACFSFAGM